MGKVTAQLAPSSKVSFLFNRNLKYRFHRRDAPYLFVEDKATVLQDQPAQNYVVQLNQVLGQKVILDARFGRMWGTFPTRYQSEVDPPTSPCGTRSATSHQRRRDPVAQPEPSLRGECHGQLLRRQPWREYPRFQGRHESCPGSGWHTTASGTAMSCSSSSTGSPRAFLSFTPINSDHKLETWAVFAQDRWMIEARDHQRRLPDRRRERKRCRRSRARPAHRCLSAAPRARCIQFLREHRAAPRHHLRPPGEQPHTQ